MVVGDGEGYVRRINVRSTEIQTSDRSTLIVPNSNLISGIVRNRVRNDRSAGCSSRSRCPARPTPTRWRRSCARSALAHREIMSEPAPRVIFKKVTENTIDFDLVCFVDDIDLAGRIASDLYFDIFRKTAAEGMGSRRPKRAGARGACGRSIQNSRTRMKA